MEVEKIWERFGRLPLASDEKGKIYGRIRKMPVSELRSLIPPFLNDAAVVASLRSEFADDAEPRHKRQRCGASEPLREIFIKQLESGPDIESMYSVELHKEEAKFSEWVLGPDENPENCGLPKDEWRMGLALKKKLHRMGYRPGLPLEGPRYKIWYE